MKSSTRPIRGRPAAPATPELIDMPEAIRFLKTTRPTFYRWVRAGRIKAMKVGRQWRFHREDLERFLKGETPRIELPVNIAPLNRILREKIEQIGAKRLLGGLAGEPGSVEETVSLTIAAGVAMRSSDIHVTTHLMEGQAESTGVIRCRFDGVLHPIATFDARLLPAIVQEWKRLAGCNIHEKEKPQDGRIPVKVGDKSIELRVSFLPACLGETITARILDASVLRLALDQIAYAPKDMERLRRALKAPWGTILVTGPTGSGKTTVLYSCLNELAGPELKTVSIEDPVEYLLPWTTQLAVRPHIGATFASLLRGTFRADPDVVLIGEIRDLETLCLIQQLALTGHLALSTLHTDDAVGALKRMLDMGANPFVVADSTRLILAQRLIRKLCRHCSAEDNPTPEQLKVVEELAKRGGLSWDDLPKHFRKPVGCGQCNQTGYRGRTVMAEVLEMTPEIGRILRQGATVEELRAIAVQQGMTTLAADGIRRAASGETALREVLVMLGKPV